MGRLGPGGVPAEPGKTAPLHSDDYLTYLRAERTPDALEKLLAARRSRRRPFDKGPYHDEYYPGEQCAYEELLLQGRFFQAEDKQIRGEIEELLVELYLLQE